MTQFLDMERSYRHVWSFSRRQALRGLIGLSAAVPLALFARRLGAQAKECATTAELPIEGPYFFGEPEEKARTGSGLVIHGVVTDAETCEPIPGARIVRWHSNRTGIYEDHYRALIIASGSGAYEMETIVPGIYAGLDRHVHFHVIAEGYEGLITQAQWDNAALPPTENEFNFALRRLPA